MYRCWIVPHNLENIFHLILGDVFYVEWKHQVCRCRHSSSHPVSFFQRIHCTNCTNQYVNHQLVFIKNNAHHIHHTYHIHSDASNINLSAFTSLCFSYKLRSYVWDLSGPSNGAVTTFIDSNESSMLERVCDLWRLSASWILGIMIFFKLHGCATFLKWFRK